MRCSFRESVAKAKSRGEDAAAKEADAVAAAAAAKEEELLGDAADVGLGDVPAGAEGVDDAINQILDDVRRHIICI